jgi:uncharacterized secreted protein with C-terminal beta-propeller domain
MAKTYLKYVNASPMEKEKKQLKVNWKDIFFYYHKFVWYANKEYKNNITK